MNTPIVFALSLEPGQSLYEPTSEEIAGLPTQKNGIPCAYRWGRAAEIGATYSHPIKKFKVPVTSKNVANWENNFQKMQKAGVAVPYVVDHSLKANDTLGYIVNLRRTDGWLEPLLQILGPDALDVASKNELSLGLKPDFVDGKGNEYPGTSIEHIAATPVPVAPNQMAPHKQNSSFTASRGDDGATVYYLSSAAHSRSNPMATPDPTVSKYRKMCMHLLGMTGDDSGGDDDQMMSKLTAEHMNLKKDISDSVPALASQVKMMSREKDALEAQLAELNLSRQETTVNAEALFERSLRVGKDFDLLVDRKVCTPAIAQEFREVVMGTKETPRTLSLSRDPENPGDDCLAAKIIAVALKFTPPPATGEVTGTQTLSRENFQTGAQGPAMRTIKSPHTGKDVQVPVVN